MTNVAVIGAGRWGKNIIATLQQLPDVTLVAVAALNEKELGEIEGNFECTTDYRSLLDKTLDGVLIATPGATHAAIALPFIERGLTTFIEKPLAISTADAERLAAAAQQSGALVSVGHVHLYNPAYQVAKELAGNAGQLRYLYCEGMNNGPYRDDMSALWDWAPHDVAMALDLLGAMPLSVQAWGLAALRPQLIDFAAIKLSFRQNITALISISWLMPEKRKKITIVGNRDSIVYDDTKSTEKVALYTGMGPQVAGNTVTRQEPAISHPNYDATPPLTLELQAFMDSIRTKRATRTPLEQGIAVTRILDSAEQSLALDGKAVTL